MNVFLIEDDNILSTSLKEYLEDENFNVEIEDSGDFANIYYLSKKFDIILLDLMLKDKKGESILKDLRNKGVDIPVIVITAKGDISSKEKCFKYGADDYIVKPFEPKELVLRINALARRIYCENCIKIKNTVINITEKTVYKNNEEINLTKTEWDMLSLLLRHRGKVIDVERIIGNVWGDKFVSCESVRTYIKNLRKKLPELEIVTYKGRGYKLL